MPGHSVLVIWLKMNKEARTKSFEDDCKIALKIVRFFQEEEFKTKKKHPQVLFFNNSFTPAGQNQSP